MKTNILSLILFLLISISCSTVDSSNTYGPFDQLQPKIDLYKQLAKEEQLRDEHGFINPEDGDSLLFSALTASVTGCETINIEAARNENGQWFRNPSHPVPQGDKGSTISRDMFVGLLFYIHTCNRLDLAEQLWDYGKEHNWIMGYDADPLDPRTLFSPTLIGTLALIIEDLGGAAHDEKVIPAIYSTEPGFTSHLAAIIMHLRLKIFAKQGKRPSFILKRIMYQWILDNPNNALFQSMYAKYVTRNPSRAINLLSSQWPENRLPTSADLCEQWRTQRKENDSNLSPCPEEGKTHSGGDFLFAASLLTEQI